MISARSVIFDGKEFGYRMAGESQDTVPVLLLHATGETSESWADFMSRWAEVGVVYALDLRGHGRSVWEGPYGLDVLAGDVVGFLDAMGLAQVDLVGHSLGGLVGCLVASGAPDRVRKLVLEDVGVPHPRVPAAVERPAGPLDFDWEWPTRAARIQADTLVLAGGPSSPVPQEHVEEMAARIPGARLVTIGGGHMVHDARPDEFAAVVMEHLTRPAG
jgi:pimeloyl-ACP methyl ester carboxylesterase